MIEIDWSKAPEGAICYGYIGIGKCAVWASDDWYQYEEPDGRRFSFDKSGLNHFSHEQLVITHRKPSKWRGPEDGLPPVGIYVEIAEGREGQVVSYPAGARVKIYAHCKHVDGTTNFAAFCDDHKQVYGVGYHHIFRPIRTPEQIAAQEREKAVKEIMESSRGQYTPHGISFDAACCIYDKGYRKQGDATEALRKITKAYRSLVGLDGAYDEALVNAERVLAGTQPAEDMSDWRNWKVGDLIECVTDELEGVYTKNKYYQVIDVTSEHADVLDDLGGKSSCWILDVHAHHFRWHSRPSA